MLNVKLSLWFQLTFASDPEWIFASFKVTPHWIAKLQQKKMVYYTIGEAIRRQSSITCLETGKPAMMGKKPLHIVTPTTCATNNELYRD